MVKMGVLPIFPHALTDDTGLDNVNYYPKMLLSVAERRLLSSDPFMLFDVGCALGIDPVWRFFGDDLHACAFDAQEEECAKLEAR